MELNLIRHGYNVQRRKMYPLNPRNNMVSTIDITWDKSLEDENKFATTRLKNKSNQEKWQIRKHYTELVDKQIDEERSLDKNSFRVLPIQKESMRYDQFGRSSIGSEHFNSKRLSMSGNIRNSTPLVVYPQNDVPKKLLASKQILQPMTVKPELKTSSNLSRTVFGYEINPENFKRQSYLTKILSDRLQPPYLQQATSSHKRHKSVMTNQIIDLGY